MDGNPRFLTAPAKTRTATKTRGGRRTGSTKLAPAPHPEKRETAVRVAFVLSQPLTAPAVTGRTLLMRALPAHVEVHALYDRRADDEPYASDVGAVSKLIPPGVERFPMRFGRERRSWWAAPVELGASFRDFVRAVRYLRRHRIGVVHGYDTARNELYCFLLARLSRAKWVSGFHSQYGDWMSPVAKTALRHADLIAAVSDWTARLIVERGDISADRVVKVMNGTETARWDPEAVDGASVRRELGIDEHVPLVVCIAQLAEWKRQHLLVRAFAQVVPRFPTAQLLLVGKEQEPWRRPGGPFEDELRKLIVELQLGANVKLVGFRTDTRAVVAAADVLAHPAVGDPGPNALIEALAMAKAIVTVDDGGSAEIVVDGESGLVGPADDVDRLAANIVALVESPELRAELGRNARRRAVQHFDMRRVADEMETLVYRRVLGLD
jgi:glycosyltransferase involved in cell wall biosynthesis